MSEIYKSFPRVVHIVDERRAVINKGALNGVEIGAKYLVFRLGDELFDPETNESLGRLEIVVGRTAVTHLQDKVATLSGTDTKRIAGAKRVIKKTPGGYNSLVSMLGTTTEEIEEGAEEVPADFDVQIGDLAKPI